MKNRRRKFGFTLAEMLMSMTILAMLMAGVSMALQGTMNSYTANNELLQRGQVVRVTLARIAHEIKAASQVSWQEIPPALVINPGQSTEVRYEVGLGGTLTYTRNGQSYTLLSAEDGITLSDMSVSFTTPEDDPTKTLLVTVRLDLTSNGETFTVYASGSPRQNHPM